MDNEAEAVLNWMVGTKVRFHYTCNEEGYADFIPYPSYGHLVEIAGNDIKASVEIGSYEGDYLFYCINRFTNKQGFGVFGYGSCSGCDMLQGCDTMEELQDAQDAILGTIVWHDTKDELIEYLENRDIKLQWYGEEEDDYTKFVAQVIALP